MSHNPFTAIKTQSSHPRTGAALVIVLAFLAIIIVLVLSFASNSIIERRASSIADTSLNTELLATMVENIVQAEVRTATTLPSNKAWASQPGMIRTYLTDGTLDKAYKLYSARSPEITGETSLTAELSADGAIAGTAFAASPALYTDLNRPVVFKSAISYPIVDPRALGKVDGFTYLGKNDPAQIPTGKFTINGTTTDQPVIPMPVQWLYVLRDGQVVAPNTGSDGRHLKIAGASSANPVVGRVAYWTDDETCKLNLNTAADGVYWDTPRAGSRGDLVRKDSERKLARYQPAQREYHRYPGHPATTSLKPVFEKYLGSATNSETYASLSPRYPACSLVPPLTGSIGGTRMPTAGLIGTTNPFYSSNDEFYFDSNRKNRGSSFLGGGNALEQTRFFVTATSRAPEVNLFNLPRVSMWPIDTDDNILKRTAYDQVNLFCSTLGRKGTPNIFAFTRSAYDPAKPDQGPNSVNGELSGRNLLLYHYLDKLMQMPIPGAGKSFADKYADDQPQILTEIYDFIRCSNLCDQSMPNNNQSTAVSKFLPFTVPPGYNGQLTETPGTGQVRPTNKGATKGFGRFPTISEAALTITGERKGAKYQATALLLLELSCVSQGPHGYGANFELSVSGLSGFDVDPDAGDGVNSTVKLFPIDSGTMTISTTTCAQGYPNWGGAMGVTLASSFDQSKIPYKGFAASYPFVGSSFTFSSADNAGYTNFTAFVADAKNFSKFQVSDGIITVDLKFPGSATPVQRFKLKFPGFTSRYPLPWIPELKIKLNKTGTPDIFFPTLEDRMTQKDPGSTGNPELQRRLPMCFDITKSIVPLGSIPGKSTTMDCDLRLLSAMSDVPENIFVKNFNYDFQDTNYPVVPGTSAWSYKPAHNLSRFTGPCGNSGGIYGGTTPSANSNCDGDFGNFVKGAICGGKSDGFCINDLPKKKADGVTDFDGVQNSLLCPGDFDTGISLMADGPWINKADEGDVPCANNPEPYYGNYQTNTVAQANFSPNRQIASPVQLGSLPTGVKACKPWQTLLFCPNPAAAFTSSSVNTSTAVHPGFGAPKDHYLLDLFWMPVVEPYAISDPSSTAGKVNLNTAMAPFPDIKRDTAVRGVLLNTKITAIPEAHKALYKARIGNLWNGTSSTANYRYPINVDRTMTEINNRFTNNKLYLSPSEICEVFLIPSADTNAVNPTPVPAPATLTSSNIQDFWWPNRLSGDNLRERPYSVIYPRLTTRSNVYTVHYTVQALKKVPGSSDFDWDENKDKVLGEQRGATTIERYIDPRDEDFNHAAYDFAARIDDPTPPTLGRFYKFRTVATRQFRP